MINISINIVIINGSGGTGKDTIVNLVKQDFNLLISNFSSVKKSKEILYSINPNNIKNEKDRLFLKQINDLLWNYNQYPLHQMLNHIQKCINYVDNDLIIFLHIREPKRIEKTKQSIYNKFKNIKVTTLLVSNSNVNPIISNDSDKYVANYNYDYYIKNDGDMDTLKCNAQKFINYLLTQEVTNEQ